MLAPQMRQRYLPRIAPTAEPLLARQRKVILVVLLGLAAAGWVVFLVGASGRTGMGMDSGPDLSMDGSAAFFIAMWVAMMVGMMFPASAPMILFYARTQRGRSLPVALFTLSYIVIWVAFGVVAFLMGVGIERLVDHSDWVAENWARVGGALILIAGLYQFTPLKNVCLAKCRTPFGFVMTEWRDGLSGALRMGLRHGLFCFGCCWLLFLIIVPIGMMNVAAMLLIAAVVFAEKTLPRGLAVSRFAAIVLLVYGLAVMLQPHLLPTTTG
jgi:predicted metal-binding membrane protein